VASAFYQANADEYIGRMVVQGNVELDLRGTAKKIGSGLEFDNQLLGRGQYLHRYTTGGGILPRIIINPSKLPVSYTFGHEMGHHFLYDEMHIGEHLLHDDRGIHEPISEAFCEFFGGKVIGELVEDTELEARAKEAYHVPSDYEAYIEENFRGIS